MSIALMGIVSTSCNHDEDFSQNETKEIRTKSLSEQKELKKVANEIENLNKQFCNGMSNDSDIITRVGPVNNNTGKKVVVVSDAVGALVGAVKGGWAGGWIGGIIGAVYLGVKTSVKVAGVIATWNYVTEKPIKHNALDANYLIISSGIPDSCYTAVSPDSIGFIHNDVAYEIFNDYDIYEYFDSLTTSEKNQFVDSIIEAKYPSLPSLVYVQHNPHSIIYDILTPYDSEYYDKAMDTAVSEALTCSSFKDYYEILETLYNVDSDEMNIMVSFVDGITNLDVNIPSSVYTAYAMNIINQSTLNLDVKNRIKIAMITGNASTRLWKDESF